MKKVLALIIPLLIGLGLYFGFKFLSNTENEVSALQVTSTPTAQVFVDNNMLGKTPFYNEKLKAGEHTIKIIPDGQTSLFTYEQKITLRSGILTVIDRVFKSTEAESEGSIIALEAIPSKTGAEIAIVSTPDGSEVKLDNQSQGVTPLLIKDVTLSDHELTLSQNGYITKTVRVRPSQGYKLTVTVKLGISRSAQVTPTIEQQATASASIRILDTPTGFLRVRETPSSSAPEIGQVKPNETYALVDESNSEWFKIKLVDGKEGYISKQYAEKKTQ